MLKCFDDEPKNGCSLNVIIHSGARELLTGGKHRNNLNVGLEFCFVLFCLIWCLKCCVINPCVVDLWLKVARGLDKPVEVIGAGFTLLAHAGCLSASKKSHFLAGEAPGAQRAQFRCGTGGFVPTFTSATAEALRAKCVTVQPSCPV